MVFSFLRPTHTTSLLPLDALTFLSPFLTNPLPHQWLQTMHRYRAPVTCAPNFAFALAQRKTTEVLRDSMDLSCVK